MASNKIRKEVEFEFSGDIAKLQTTLANISKEMGKVKMPEVDSTRINKQIEKIKNEMLNLQAKTQGDKVDLVDVKDVQKSIKKIQELFAGLQIVSTKFTKNSGFTALTNQAKKYAEQLENLEKAQKALRVAEGVRTTFKKKREGIIAKDSPQNKVRAESLTRKENERNSLQENLRSLRKNKDYKSAFEKQASNQSLDANEEALLKTAKEAEDNIQKLNSEIAELKKNIKTIDPKAAKELDEQIKQATVNVERMRIGVDDLSEKSSQTLDKMKQFFASIGVDISNLSSVEDIEQAIESLTPDQIANLKGEFDGLGQSIDGAVEQSRDFQKRVNNDFEGLVKDAEEVNESFEEMSQQIKMFFGLSNSIQLFQRAITNAFDSIKELDAAMTEIAVVSDYNIEDMWDTLPEFTKRANELGVAITEVYDATGLYVQQGLDLVESQGLANETLKMARVAGMDAASSTDAMTAALHAFNMELNETSAEKISDVYSKLAAITAADVQEISTAMSKTASIASAAGASLENTAAFLSQIIETTRESAETAGTSMKTVIAKKLVI